MGTIFWVGIQTSCSDLSCLSAVQLLLQLRQMLDIMVVALSMEDIVAMEDMDMDMAAVILVKGQLMLNQKLILMLATFIVDMDMASMVVDTLEREMLMLNPRLKQDIIEDMAIVDMEDIDTAVASMAMDTLEREMLMLNPRLKRDIMEDTAIVDMEDMDMAVGSMVVDTLEREMLMLNPRLKQDIMEDMAIVDMEDMDMAVVSMVVDTLE